MTLDFETEEVEDDPTQTSSYEEEERDTRPFVRSEASLLSLLDTCNEPDLVIGIMKRAFERWSPEGMGPHCNTRLLIACLGRLASFHDGTCPAST